MFFYRFALRGSMGGWQLSLGATTYEQAEQERDAKGGMYVTTNIYKM